jgi:hypothetical protein
MNGFNACIWLMLVALAYSLIFWPVKVAMGDEYEDQFLRRRRLIRVINHKAPANSGLFSSDAGADNE